MYYKKNKNGASVIEVVVALGVMVVVITNVAVLYVNATNGTAEINKKFQAEMLLQQGFEAIRAIRDYNLGDPDIPACDSSRATIYVNESNIIVGGPDDGNTYSGTLNGWDGLDDVIIGTNGVDIINGNSGNDTICGQDGDDNISGGDGEDTIDGGTGDDTVTGDNDDDYITDMDGDNTIRGDNGNDIIFVGGGDDTIYGGYGDEYIDAFGGNNFIEGEQDNDVISTGAGDDVIRGRGGDDIIHSGAGDDFVHTHTGIDIICGGDGNDYVSGGDHDDKVDGGDGTNNVRGDQNYDICANGNSYYQCETQTGSIPECDQPINPGDYGIVLTKGLTKSSGYWEYFGESDIIGEFERTIEFENVFRDENCNIMESGGEPDPDTQKMTITIDWDQDEQIPRTILATKYFHNWVSPGRCEDEAEDLSLDIGQAYLGVNNKKLLDITLENQGLLDITIDKITLEWTADSKIEWIVIEQDDVWKYHGGGGSPEGRQNSGTELDIVDYVIPAYESHNLKEIKFEDSVNGSTFDLTITLIDGSSVTAFIDPN